MVREKSLKLNFIKKTTSKILINKKTFKEPRKTGDTLFDFVNEFSYHLGIDPKIFNQSNTETNTINSTGTVKP